MTQITRTAMAMGLAAPMQMASGKLVDLSKLAAADIHWPDLVESLVKLPRFNGATSHVTYTTAQHCCLMYDRAEDLLKARALLADFHCAYFGDISQSFFSFAAMLSGDPDGFLNNIALAKDEVTSAIYEAAGIKEDDNPVSFRETEKEIRKIDKRQTATEVRDLMAPCQTQGHWQLPAPYPPTVKAWGQDEARTQLELRMSKIGLHPRG